MMETKMYALAEVKSTESDSPHGEFEVILSAPTLDRDGEVIDAKVFEPLPDHVTFDIDHGMSTATTVGSGTPYYDGDVLKVNGTFSSIPRAQEVRTLVAEGHIRTTSVAFMSAEREEKDGVTHITRAELLNGAFVPIPSNRDALVLSAKAFDEKAGARNSAKDAERMQSIHDLSVANGAMCEGKTHEPEQAPTDSATQAPETPSEDGKSPASEVVEQARLRAELALLT
jgi:phage head maturation protease